MSIAQFYTKIFGVGLLMGAAMEVVLIKSNYYEMLAASEAKQRMKEKQENEERMKRLRTEPSETRAS